MKLFLTIVLLLALMSMPGNACLLLLGAGCGAGSFSGGGTMNGKILLVDGSSFLLQTDAVSKVCLAGGC